MWLINGEWRDNIALVERGLQFGDGCFTSARVIDGDVRFLDDHMRRLEEGCRRLDIPMPERQTLLQDITSLAQAERKATLKVVICRGSGGRGYGTSGCGESVRMLRLFSAPTHYADLSERGALLMPVPVPLGCNPWLAGIKHLNRLEQILIRKHLDQIQADEALVLDTEGHLTECCAANLFWRKGKNVYTPRLDRAGVDGTMRQRILRLLANSPWHAQQVRAPLEALQEAEEVFICNALMPILPVRQASCWRYSSRALYQFLAPKCE
ncbi:aminodeoxychorismate lyase [Erwinia sp. HR93]|uniref:aminodeoxychorismate lyase n=1 Tax=Erwinia sp. HR93 TaxID=3094840 RepID=UPI002ADED1FE|nr:aminodeoxychorismate lyase [Erwinia sp. HR93]MEA1064822.1 aminodeoxychorismate lyase [Erwinia sp. HR93]